MIKPTAASSAVPTARFGLAGHPPGLSNLFFTELWERFSFYGMRALLTLFMVAPIADGGLGLATVDAGRYYGNYSMAAYMLAIPGGFVADRFLGARQAVLWGGWIIALGHYVLAVPTHDLFFAGLALVAFGTGLFKPNISALVGALYAPDDTRRDAGFSLFYMGINIGAFLSPLITGFVAQSPIFKAWLADAGFDPAQSWHWGFAVAGIGMTIAMVVFRRNTQVPETPPRGLADPKREIKPFLLVIGGTLAVMSLAFLSDAEGWQWLRYAFVIVPLIAVVYFGLQPGTDQKRLAAVGILFIAAVVFWAIFEQAGTTIALFADRMTDRNVFGFLMPAPWFQSINPVFVILLAPVIAALWVSLGSRQPSAGLKFAIGLALLAASFALMVPAAMLAAAGKVSPLWLVALFFLQTLGELLVSPIGLSTMTRLAPANSTGLLLGVWLMATALGNKLAGVLGGSFTPGNSAEMAFFQTQALWVAGAALLLFLMVPAIKQLSAGR